MIDLIKKLFEPQESADRSPSQEDKAHHIQVAACALLLEMASIDGEFSDVERDRIVDILKREYGFSQETAAALMEASETELDESVDLWRFARTINEQYSADEKMRVMELIWKVVFADGRLDQHEDYLAHKVSRLLRLGHAQLIETKMKVLGKA
jgi:uncharacterized tellurite resistance protein B-like protein